jgi:hypothetical protein
MELREICARQRCHRDFFGADERPVPCGRGAIRRAAAIAGWSILSESCPDELLVPGELRRGRVVSHPARGHSLLTSNIAYAVLYIPSASTRIVRSALTHRQCVLVIPRHPRLHRSPLDRVRVRVRLGQRRGSLWNALLVCGVWSRARCHLPCLDPTRSRALQRERHIPLRADTGALGAPAAGRGHQLWGRDRHWHGGSHRVSPSPSFNGRSAPDRSRPHHRCRADSRAVRRPPALYAAVSARPVAFGLRETFAQPSPRILRLPEMALSVYHPPAADSWPGSRTALVSNLSGNSHGSPAPSWFRCLGAFTSSARSYLFRPPCCPPVSRGGQ